MWLALLPLAEAAPTLDELRAALDVYDRGAAFPLPKVSDEDLARLQSGEVVKILSHGANPDEPGRAIGLLWSPVERASLWVSCQDPDFDSPSGTTEALVSRTGPDRAKWYAYLDLPSPLSDRQWVVDVWNNHALAQASRDAAWEHPWRLEPDGVAQVQPLVLAGAVGKITMDMLESAVYTPFNEGAWMAVRVPSGGTLFGYQVRATVGGGIPDWMLTRYVYSGLESMLRRVEARAKADVAAHYRAGHRPIYGGSGEPVPTW